MYSFCLYSIDIDGANESKIIKILTPQQIKIIEHIIDEYTTLSTLHSLKSNRY